MDQHTNEAAEAARTAMLQMREIERLREQLAKAGAAFEREQDRADAAEKDAERYRWLRSEHERHDPICHLVWKRNGDRSSSEWVNTARLDASIDLAMQAAQEVALHNAQLCGQPAERNE